MPVPSIGFRVVSRINRPDPKRYERLAQATTANVTDAMNRMGTLHPSIKPIVEPKGPIVGPAVTVKARAGDNLLIVKGILLCQPGDVLVVSAGGSDDQALWGGVLSTLAISRGIVGLVTDGYVRDVAEMRTAGLPVWARGVIPTGPSADGKGEVNTPISCAGVPVHPGDIVVADSDGVVVVPIDDLDDVASRTPEIIARDLGWLTDIKVRGSFPAADNVDARLEQLGCIMQD